jgi:hypothetical protein
VRLGVWVETRIRGCAGIGGAHAFVAASVRKQKLRGSPKPSPGVLPVRECSTDDRSSGRGDGDLDGGQLESMSHENVHKRDRMRRVGQL